MKAQNNTLESLWELWNAPSEMPDNSVTREAKLQALHKAIGREQKHEHKRFPAYIGFCAVAALSIVCVCLSVSLSRNKEYRDSLAQVPVTVSAGQDGPTSLILPDGTSVVLNARSTITYNMDFGISDRCVSLEGQGFFDVTRNPEKKFVVNTPNMKISVHGTKFNVYAYPERKLDEVSLVEGSVSVESGGNELKMVPGEKVLYDKSTGGTHLVKTDNSRETAWLGKELNFSHAPLYTVFDVLERRFGVTIVPAPRMDLSDCYTGSFTDRNLSDIMSIFKMHYGFSYHMDGSTLILE